MPDVDTCPPPSPGLSGPRPGVSLPMAVIVALAALIAGYALAQRGPAAEAQQFVLPTPLAQPPAAAAGEIVAVAGPLSDRAYGLYVVDAARRSVAVYEYVAGDRNGKALQLRAVRNFGYDSRLMNYNTSPDPAEIAELVGQDRSSSD